MSTLTVRAVPHEDGSVVLVVEGELDLATAPQLVAAAEDALASTSEGDVALDLSEVHFIDSTGIGAVIQVRGLALARSRRTKVCAASDMVVRVLDLTGLSEDLVDGSPR